MWVIAELEDGEPMGVTYELLVAHELVAKAGEKSCAVLGSLLKQANCLKKLILCRC